MRESLGERIAHYRKLKKLSQGALASALSVDKITVWRWENGKSWPEYDKLMAIAKELDINAERLFETIGKTAPVERSHSIQSLSKLIEEQDAMLKQMAHATSIYERIQKHPILRKMWDLSDKQLIRLARRVSLMEDEPVESEGIDSTKLKGKI